MVKESVDYEVCEEVAAFVEGVWQVFTELGLLQRSAREQTKESTCFLPHYVVEQGKAGRSTDVVVSTCFGEGGSHRNPVLVFG